LRWAALAAGLFVLAGCGSNTQSYNDTPTITNLFPSSTTAGGQGFRMNISGNGYISTSTAYWNNTQLPTTFNSTTLQLSASVPAPDIANPGVAQVTVVTPSPGGGASNAATFTINPTQNSVPTISSLSPASTPVGVLPSNNVLLVNGTNFVQASTVAFNGNSRATTFVSSVQLSVPMSAPDVAANTTITVTASNPPPGGGVSNAVSFKIGTGSAVRLKSNVVASGAQFPQVVSASALGNASNGQSAAPAISADGRFIAFYSSATNLVAQGAFGNVFVRDTCLGSADCSSQTIAVDLASDGNAPNGPAGMQVAISGDGRFVAFTSSATNLVAGGQASAASQSSVYVRDLCIGPNAPADCVRHTQLVSASAGSNMAMGASDSPSVSIDGRFIAFVSSWTDVVSDSASPASGVFVADTCAGPSATSTCVAKTYSVTSIDPLHGDSFASPVISPDGRYVAFVVRSSSAPTASQVLLADRCLGIDAVASCKPSVSKVSVSAEGSDLAGLNEFPSISGDGRFVAFKSQTSGATANVFLRDTCLGVSATTNCVPSTAVLLENASAPSISSAGRSISYVTTSAAVSAADGPSMGSLYVYDTCFGATAACSPQSYAVNGSSVVSNAAPFAVSASSSAPMSSDGSFIAFSACSAIGGLPFSGQGDVLLSITPF